MQLDTIEVSKSEARAKVAEYLRAVRDRHDAEDAAILRGYRALAKGHALIRLPDVIERGGYDDTGRPMLAVARADQRHVFLRVSRTRSARVLTFGNTDRGAQTPSRAKHPQQIISVVVPDHDTTVSTWGIGGRAIVPIVPPALRPATSLAGYHVLFEAEWQNIPPRDPALLKHVGGELWAVCATWDLTDLELAVLAGRSRER